MYWTWRLEKIILDSFLSEKTQHKIFSIKSWENLKPLCCWKVTEKIRKGSWTDFSQNLKNLILVKKKKNFFPQKIISVAVNSSKNQKRSMHWFLIKPKKPHFDPISNPFCRKKLKTGFYPNSHLSQFYVYCNLMQKIRQILTVNC